MHWLYADLQDNKQTISNGEPKANGSNILPLKIFMAI